MRNGNLRNSRFGSSRALQSAENQLLCPQHRSSFISLARLFVPLASTPCTEVLRSAQIGIQICIATAHFPNFASDDIELDVSTLADWVGGSMARSTPKAARRVRSLPTCPTFGAGRMPTTLMQFCGPHSGRQIDAHRDQPPLDARSARTYAAALVSAAVVSQKR